MVKILDHTHQSSDLKFWETKDEECYERFLKNYGWYTSAYFYEWIGEVIAEKFEGNPRATFADFRERGFRDLYIVAANLSRHRAEVFSADDTPNVAVADAVRMSMSIPIFFEALRFDGSNDWVDFQNPAVLNFSDAFTFSAWINFQDGSQNRACIISKLVSYQFYVVPATDSLGLQVWSPGAGRPG